MISPEILRRYPYFASAKDEGLRDLAMICEEELIPAGTVMYREGDKADKLFILVDGEVDIQYTLGSGELRTVDTIVPGELLMWSALVEPYKSTAVVTTRAEFQGHRSGCGETPPILLLGSRSCQRSAPAPHQTARHAIGGSSNPTGHDRLNHRS